MVKRASQDMGRAEQQGTRDTASAGAASATGLVCYLLQLEHSPRTTQHHATAEEARGRITAVCITTTAAD